MGKTIVTELFGEGVDPIGRTIRFKSIPMRIVGVLKSKGYNSWGMDQDNVMIAPYTTVMKRVAAQTWFSSIVCSAVTEELSDAAIEELTQILRDNHKLKEDADDDFTIRSQAEMMETMSSTQAPSSPCSSSSSRCSSPSQADSLASSWAVAPVRFCRLSACRRVCPRGASTCRSWCVCSSVCSSAISLPRKPPIWIRSKLSAMNKRVVILLHVAVWVLMFITPLTYMRGYGFSLLRYLMMCASPLLLMIVFYLNYLWLTPHYFVKGKHRYYLLVNLVMVICLGIALHYWMTFVHSYFEPAHAHPHRVPRHLQSGSGGRYCYHHRAGHAVAAQ